MTAVYGHAFLGRWSGMDMAPVYRSWGEDLAVFANHPDAIKFGLQHLPPSDPPTVLAFKALCLPSLRDERQAPALALPAPKANPEKVAALVASVDRSLVKNPKEWAWKLKAREEYEAKNPPDSRHRMTPYQREAWRKAIGDEIGKAAAEQAEGMAA